MAILSEQFKKALIAGKFEGILGQEGVKQALKSTLLAQRHVVLLGPPGVGKTTLAKQVAELLEDATIEIAGVKKKLSGTERFVRVQGSPDLTAEDLLGDIDPMKALEFGPLSVEAFTPGKIFKANKGVLFFDEINRAPEKLQNALLQVLSEGKITIGSYDVDFESDFLLIATMNPEDSSTETLSEVLMDRFDVITVSYPESMEVEIEIVKQKGAQLVNVPQKVLKAIVHYVRSLRADRNLERVPSVRATLGLYDRSQSQALLKGKSKVGIEEVREVLDSVIGHRIRLKPSMRMVKNVRDFVREKFEKETEEFERDSANSGADEHQPETGDAG